MASSFNEPTAAAHLSNHIFITTARLFERIPIQDQAYNRKSFTSRADTTATWQRKPRPARPGELQVHPESLQTKLSDNFIPALAGEVARNRVRSDPELSVLVPED